MSNKATYSTIDKYYNRFYYIATSLENLVMSYTYNLIFIIVDKFIKATKFIPF